MELIFIDGNDLRAREVQAIMPTAQLKLEALIAGFATSAPEPAQKAHDKVEAHPTAVACFAEAVDLTTLDGKSLRLELDSENENRFCKWWREKPVRFELRVAFRRANTAAIEVLTATCEGRIADKPAGPHLLGWERLFVPEGEDETLAQLTAKGMVTEFRLVVYSELARTFGLTPVELGAGA